MQRNSAGAAREGGPMSGLKVRGGAHPQLRKKWGGRLREGIKERDVVRGIPPAFSNYFKH